MYKLSMVVYVYAKISTLMMKEIDTKIHIILEDFKQLTKNPECFLESNDSLRNKIKTSLKKSYDATKYEELNSNKCVALPELIIQNFDIEQIWQQIELQNEVVVSDSVPNISKLIAVRDRLVFKNLEDEVHVATNNKIIESDKNEIVDNFNGECDEIESESDNSRSDTEITEQDLSNDISDEENARNQIINHKSSIVDDKFFNLYEMENFLKAEERKIQNKDSGNDSEESVSDAEDNIDLFESNSDDDDKVKTAKFKDFFIAKDDGRKSKTKNISDTDDWQKDQSENESPIKSSLELREERLKKRIHEIEQNNVTERPWQLKGEITADNRPQNSLLEEIVEFDLTTKPAPIITEQTTLQLEDIIRQRIKDKAFDSVVRKVKPVETPIEYKKKLVLDQEKSKHSLAQIYEKEFLEQQASLDPDNKDKEDKEPELHTEIKNFMRILFSKLDSLSNFHFTPKPAIPELRVVNNLPSISIEEVAPVSASDGALLAPEEVKNKSKGEVMGKTERTTTDKNRERRKKKQKQRAHLKEKQKKETLNLGKTGRTTADKSRQRRNKKQKQEAHIKEKQKYGKLFSKLIK